MTAPSSVWLPPPERLTLDAGTVHVWRASLGMDASTLEALRTTLSPDEHQRADRFHFQRDRSEYIAARGALREIVGRYLEVRAERVRFAYSSYGKPTLSADMGAGWLHFNVSHARGIALFAVANERQVGVDIECIREDIETGEIAARFFSRDEQSALDRLPSHRRLEAFFDCWTRKEAYIKALGEGLSHPLESFTVSLAAGEACSLRGTGVQDAPALWSLEPLAPGPGYAGALAVEGVVSASRCLQWGWERAPRDRAS